MTDHELAGAGSSEILCVGSMLQLMLDTQSGQVLCSSTLLGWKSGEWTISELPFQEGKPLDCPRGTPCLVRYFLSGKLIGYRTKVLNTQVEPEGLLYLGFPKKAEQILLRRHSRVSANQPVTLTPLSSVGTGHTAAVMPVVKGMLQDVSVGGCGISVDTSVTGVSPGMELRVHFDLPGIGHITNLSGTVKSIRPRVSDIVLGLEFHFNQKESVEFVGWGGTVQKAIEQFVLQRTTHTPPASDEPAENLADRDPLQGI